MKPKHEIKHHNFFKVHIPNRYYDLEDPKDAVELFMEEFSLLYGQETTKNFKSTNPLEDEFSIILYPSLVYAAHRFKSTENERFQYINTVIDNAFISFLERFNPLYKCTGFIDYHMHYYKGEKSDFIKHIKYQIIPLVHLRKGKSDNEIDYENLSLILSDWVLEKSKLNSHPIKEGLLNDLIGVSRSFIDHLAIYKSLKDENKYNTIIANLLNQRLSSKSWTAKDQTLGGSSLTESTANRAGLSFRDILISDNLNNNISMVECFRLYSVPKKQTIKSSINSHLTKMFLNEPLGISPLFTIVYCETKSFSKTWQKYLDYYREIDFGMYQQKGIIDISNEILQIANLKIARAIHNREGSEITVYHLFINMEP